MRASAGFNWSCEHIVSACQVPMNPMSQFDRVRPSAAVRRRRAIRRQSLANIAKRGESTTPFGNPRANYQYADTPCDDCTRIEMVLVSTRCSPQPESALLVYRCGCCSQSRMGLAARFPDPVRLIRYRCRALRCFRSLGRERCENSAPFEQCASVCAVGGHQPGFRAYMVRSRFRSFGFKARFS